MTRREKFWEQYGDIDDLISFCKSKGFDEVDEYYTADERDETIDEYLGHCDLEWREIRDYLCEIPESSYGYYKSISYFEWEEAEYDDYDDILSSIEYHFDIDWDEDIGDAIGMDFDDDYYKEDDEEIACDSENDSDYVPTEHLEGFFGINSGIVSSI